MPILTDSGRSAIATAVKLQTLHLAWGEGDPAWDEDPVPEPVGATSIVAEIGRRAVTETQYVLPDPEGEIVVQPGRFTVSPTPTKYLYMRFSFDFDDAPEATIRNLGVFMGTILKPGVPPGTQYVTPSQIQDGGQLLLLERIQRLERSPTIRQRFEYVIQF